MSNIFSDLTTDGLEETGDRLGGGFQPLDSDVYDGTIKLAYAGTAASGARNVTVVLDLQTPAGAREYRETVYVTNKQGQNYYPDKNDPKKKNPLPGFTTIDELCLCSTGLPLASQTMENKIVKVWDFEAKAEIPKEVPVITSILGKPVTVAIQKSIVDKTQKVEGPNGTTYEPTGDTREENAIDKVFHTESGKTVTELRKGLEAGFRKSWIDRNKGQVRDRSTKITAGGNPAGRVQRPQGGGNVSGQASSPAANLFSKG